MNASQWVAEDQPDSVHVVPIDDTIEHAMTDGCVCGPRVEYYAVPLVIHASLDGRELVYG